MIAMIDILSPTLLCIVVVGLIVLGALVLVVAILWLSRRSRRGPAGAVAHGATARPSDYQPRPKVLCPTCGSDLPPGAPHGLCPRCMLKVAIEETAPPAP